MKSQFFATNALQIFFPEFPYFWVCGEGFDYEQAEVSEKLSEFHQITKSY